jgi:hypothetical protein
MFGSGVGSVDGSVAVGGGGALRVRLATTVWAAWVWITPTSWVGAGGADEPQALSTTLSIAKRTQVTKIRELMYVFMVTLEAVWQYSRICQTMKFGYPALKSRNRGVGNLSAARYAPKHTYLPLVGHAIKCFIFVLFRRGKREVTVLG